MLDGHENHRTHPIVSILQQGVSGPTAVLFLCSYALLSMHTRAAAAAHIPAPAYGVEYEIPLARPALALSWSPDGRFLALVQKMPNGAKVSLVAIRRHTILFSRTFRKIPSLGFGDRTHLLVAAPGGNLLCYQVPSGRLQWKSSMPAEAVMAATGGGRIAVITRQGIEIRDAHNGMVTARLAGSNKVAKQRESVIWLDGRTVMAFDAKTRKIYSWSTNRRFPRTSRVPGCPRPPLHAAFSSSGLHLALLCPVGNGENALMSLYGVLPGGTPIRAYVSTVGMIRAKATTNLSVSDGKDALAWGLRFGGALLRTKADFVPLPAAHRAATIASLSPRGLKLALATSRVLTLLCRGCRNSSSPSTKPQFPTTVRRHPPNRVLPFLGGRRYIHAHQKKAYALALTKRVLVTSGADGTLAMFDRWSGTLLRRIGRPGPVHAEWVEADPQGNKLVVAWGDGQLSLHDARSGRVLLAWPGHPNAVFEAHFSRDGRRILSCGEDGIPKIWDVSTGRNIALVPSIRPNKKRLSWGSRAANPVNTCAFHPNKPWVAMGTPNGQIGWVNWITRRVAARQKIPGGPGVMSLLSWDKTDRILATTTRGLCLWSGRSNQIPTCRPTSGNNIGMTWVDPYHLVAVGNANPTPGVILIDVTAMKIVKRLVATPRKMTPGLDLAKGKAIFDLAFDPALRLLHGTLQSGWVVTWRLVP